MNEIEYEFSELPLIVEGAFEAALINGSAIIRYEDVDGEWSVSEIALDGSRLRPKDDPAPLVGGLFEFKPVALCQQSNPWLYATIVDRLENDPRFRAAIDDRIAEAIENRLVRVSA